MPVYTVHGPVPAAARPAADRIVFIRDGFSWSAFLLGPFWAIWHRLWWVLLGYVMAMGIVLLAMAALGLAPDARLVIDLLIAVLMGLEAASLQRWTLSRGKWRQLDLVVAGDRDAAEQRFFDRWTGVARYNEPTDRGAPPPARAPIYTAAPADGIIGLFPQPGGAPR